MLFFKAFFILAFFVPGPTAYGVGKKLVVREPFRYCPSCLDTYFLENDRIVSKLINTSRIDMSELHHCNIPQMNFVVTCENSCFEIIAAVDRNHTGKESFAYRGCYDKETIHDSKLFNGAIENDTYGNVQIKIRFCNEEICFGNDFPDAESNWIIAGLIGIGMCFFIGALVGCISFFVIPRPIKEEEYKEDHEMVTMNRPPHDHNGPHFPAMYSDGPMPSRCPFNIDKDVVPEPHTYGQQWMTTFRLPFEEEENANDDVIL